MAEVRGIKEIDALLRDLPEAMQRNVVRSGNRAVAKEISERVQKGGRVHFLVRMAATFRQNPKGKATGAFKVALRGRWGRLAHLFEFGTSARQRKSGGSTGAMQATPFLRPAVDGMSADEVAKTWAKAASRNLDLQLKKVRTL